MHQVANLNKRLVRVWQRERVQGEAHVSVLEQPVMHAPIVHDTQRMHAAVWPWFVYGWQ